MGKIRQISESYILAVLLTLSGGFMDAYSYMCRDQVFANAQTGNMLLFGVNIANGQFDTALKYLCPIIAFALGIFLAQTTRLKLQKVKWFHWRQFTVFIEIIILLIVAFLPQNLNLLANSMTSLACGAQVQSFRKISGRNGVATTMCIGNLRNAIQEMSTYRITKSKDAKSNSLLYFSIILIFITGAVLGDFAVNLFSEKAILISCVLLTVSFLMMFINYEENKKTL